MWCDNVQGHYFYDNYQSSFPASSRIVLCVTKVVQSDKQWLPYTIRAIYRVSQEECEILRESIPYVKLYRYNPKHLYPKLNGYGDNAQRSLKLWQLLLTYWLPNTYWNWQEYVVSVMLISVLNIKVTCEWHKAIKLNDKNTHLTVLFVVRFPNTLRSLQLFLILWRQS